MLLLVATEPRETLGVGMLIDWLWRAGVDPKLMSAAAGKRHRAARAKLKKAALPIGEASAASKGQRQSMEVGGDSCIHIRGTVPRLSTMPKCLVELPSPNGRARPERGSTRHLRMDEVHG